MSSSRSVVTSQPLQSVTLPLQVGNTLQRPSGPPRRPLQRRECEGDRRALRHRHRWDG